MSFTTRTFQLRQSDEGDREILDLSMGESKDVRDFENLAVWAKSLGVRKRGTSPIGKFFSLTAPCTHINVFIL